MRFKVTSDGSLFGTSVTNAETGESIPCTRVAFSHEVDDTPRLSLDIIGTASTSFELDLSAPAEVKAVEPEPGDDVSTLSTRVRRYLLGLP